MKSAPHDSAARGRAAFRFGTRIHATLYYSGWMAVCAAILAFFERFPCEIPTPKKGRAKPGKGQVCCERSVASLPCVTPQLRVVQPAGLRKKQRRAALRAARCMEAFSVALDRIPLSAV